MKIVFKKLSLKDNIEIVKWTLFDENEISNFRHYAIELFPELENVKENETSRIEELVTKKYNESLNTIESEIERYLVDKVNMNLVRLTINNYHSRYIFNYIKNC